MTLVTLEPSVTAPAEATDIVRDDEDAARL
jgi:hypothetical protein